MKLMCVRVCVGAELQLFPTRPHDEIPTRTTIVIDRIPAPPKYSTNTMPNLAPPTLPHVPQSPLHSDKLFISALADTEILKVGG